MWYYAVYDHRWRMIEVRRDETSLGGPDQARYERFYYRCAGFAGSENASYIDCVIRRDRNAVVATSGPETLEETFYYLQNWRGDVISMMSADGTKSEQVRYSSYGRPMRLTNGSLQADFDASGTVEVADIFSFLNAWFAQYNVCTGPSCSADIDGNELVEVADIFAFLNNWFSSFGSPIVNFDSLSTLGNRKGYAGYEHDPLWPTMMHVRHRVYRADLGAWMRRDPLGYIDGGNLYRYVSALAIKVVDPACLFITPAIWSICFHSPSQQTNPEDDICKSCNSCMSEAMKDPYVQNIINISNQGSRDGCNEFVKLQDDGTYFGISCKSKPPNPNADDQAVCQKGQPITVWLNCTQSVDGCDAIKNVLIEELVHAADCCHGSFPDSQEQTKDYCWKQACSEMRACMRRSDLLPRKLYHGKRRGNRDACVSHVVNNYSGCAGAKVNDLITYIKTSCSGEETTGFQLSRFRQIRRKGNEI